MRSLYRRILWLLSTTLVVAEMVPLSSISLEPKLPIVQNRFIMEFSDIQQARDTPVEDRQLHERVYASLKKRDIALQVDREFNTPGLFVGAVVTLEKFEDAKTIADTPGVIAVRPVKLLQAAKPVTVQMLGQADVAAPPSDTESTHVMTGVDKLHAEGVTGKGVKIGIIDTGIDYTHPLLGGGFGPGFKVIGGHDFVGDAYNGSITPHPSPNPLDQCNGHGTHVAGIIGANPGNQFNISGVAYDAKLSAYRVFGCSGITTDEIIVDALLLGYKQGNDILTLSLGGADGWTESSSSIVASRIASRGKVVTIAAGNEGSSGSWYSSSPGNGINVISIASVENTAIPLQQAVVGGVKHSPILYSSLFPLPITGILPIYATSTNTTITNDACNPLPPSTPDLSSYLVVIRRGACTFSQKLENIAAKGGKAALIYDNGNEFGYISVGGFTAAMIQAADGEYLVKQFAAGVHATITFPQTGGSVNFQNPRGGLVSSFSSYGPSNDFYFKPAVAAPGGNILSTLPVRLGSFGVLSGTSMATPFVAGSAALLLQAKGKGATVALSARNLFETTAKTVPSSHVPGDPLQTVTQQGAGLIQVHNAIHFTTVVTPGELILNDTAYFQGTHTITVTNTGKLVKTYKLAHVPAGTANTVRQHSIFPNVGPVPLSTQYATVTFTKAAFTLEPGSSTEISVTINQPKDIDRTTFPVFSGFIQIDSGTENLHVTYLGLAASLKDKQIVDNTTAFFGYKLPALVNKSGKAQVGPLNYTFVKGNVPRVLIRLVFGTPILRIDLVSPHINLTPTLNRRDEGADIYSFPQDTRSPGQLPIVGRIAEFNYVTRNNEDPQDNGYQMFRLNAPAFSNGTAIPNGSYRLLLRALRVTGNRQNEKDYETWLSPLVNIMV